MDPAGSIGAAMVGEFTNTNVLTVIVNKIRTKTTIKHSVVILFAYYKWTILEEEIQTHRIGLEVNVLNRMSSCGVKKHHHISTL